jgi:hypothetical protein
VLEKATALLEKLDKAEAVCAAEMGVLNAATAAAASGGAASQAAGQKRRQ